MIKQVLPAILNSSRFLQEKYANAIYGADGGIPSLNYRNWKWIEYFEDRVLDPYKLLPNMFERPARGFNTLVEGSVKVNQLLKNGDIIELGQGSNLKIVYTPGHSKGHIALFHEQDGVLISGDSIPLPGQVPIYEDVNDSLRSIEKLKSIKDVRVILTSWDEPPYGSEVQQVLAKGEEHIRIIHRKVLQAKNTLNTSETIKIAREVFDSLELSESEFTPLFFRTIKAHLQASDSYLYGDE